MPLHPTAQYHPRQANSKGGQRIAREQEHRDLWRSEFIGGTVARTFINVTGVSFPSHMPPFHDN